MSTVSYRDSMKQNFELKCFVKFSMIKAPVVRQKVDLYACLPVRFRA